MAIDNGLSRNSLLISTLILKGPMKKDQLFEFIALLVKRLKESGEQIDSFLSFSGPYSGQLGSTGLSCCLNYWISNGLVFCNDDSTIGLTENGKKLLSIDHINRGLSKDRKQTLIETIEKEGLKNDTQKR